LQIPQAYRACSGPVKRDRNCERVNGLVHWYVHGYAGVMVAEHIGPDGLVEHLERRPPEDIWAAVGAARPDPRGWVIVWSLAPPDWATVRHPDMPAGLVLRIRVAPTEDGFAVAGVLVERDDGRAVTARDLRRVKLPPAWTLASHLMPLPESAAVRPAKSGPRGLGDDHWRAVLELRARAERAAPHAPVRWMRAQWPGEPSDATMRRWIKRAREHVAADRPGGHQADAL
jgi:hypothetical protein